MVLKTFVVGAHDSQRDPLPRAFAVDIFHGSHAGCKFRAGRDLLLPSQAQPPGGFAQLAR